MSVKFMGWGRLNLNSQLLPTKYSGFMLNLLKVCIDLSSMSTFFSVGVFSSNLFWFNEMGCFK